MIKGNVIQAYLGHNIMAIHKELLVSASIIKELPGKKTSVILYIALIK
jgi:hypothetical protein